MARYLLSTHTVEGEARPPMTDDEMEQFMARIGALEEEMRSAGAWVFSGRRAHACSGRVASGSVDGVLGSHCVKQCGKAGPAER